MRRARAVYLVECTCFRTTPGIRVPTSTFVEHSHLMPHLFDGGSVSFMARLLERSGLGEESCLPAVLSRSLEAFLEEAELVVFSTVDELFAKTSLTPADIDVLITNCSVFSPTPSFSDMVMNRYKLRSDLRSVHLSGMGCSTTAISTGLARNLLQVAPPGAHALACRRRSSHCSTTRVLVQTKDERIRT